MQKVRLIGNALSKKMKNEGKNIVDDLYLGKDAIVESLGCADGVYYIKNFPKDIQYIIKGEQDRQKLIDLGFKFDEKELYPNNIFIKEKEKSIVYIVKPLDTLDKICEKFNLEKEEIVKINALKCENLFVGQRLIVDN